MQHGDLGTWSQPTIVVILEGVLADVQPILVEEGRFRKKLVEHGCNLSWHDLPLKRLITMGNRWADYRLDIVTFTNEVVAEFATTYLDMARVPYGSVAYHPFDTWVNVLRYQPDIRQVIDTDYERIQRYGQVGRMVQRGEDFG